MNVEKSVSLEYKILNIHLFKNIHPPLLLTLVNIITKYVKILKVDLNLG